MNSSTLITNSDPNRMIVDTVDENALHQIQPHFNPASFQTNILGSESETNHYSDTSSADKKQSKNKSLICVVCGANALGRNFGVVACESCKLFFRRNGLKDPTNSVCFGRNECEVNLHTRRCCLPCRLRKCLSSGMKRDRLLNAEEKAAKRLKQAPSTVPDPTIVLEGINVSTHGEKKILLTDDDLKRIEAIRVAFENRIELASREGFGNNFQAPATKYSEYFYKNSVSAVRLVEFFKQIPEFKQLSVEDRLVLIKYNLMSIITFYYVVSFKQITSRIFEIDTNIPWDRSVLGAIHGDDIFLKMKHLFLPLIRFAKSDNACILLLLIVLIFLKGISIGGGASEPILLDGLSAYRAHNFYTELLWKYLQKNYSFRKATRIMSKMVTRFLSWQNLQIKMRSHVQERLTETNVDDLSGLMKSLFHI